MSVHVTSDLLRALPKAELHVHLDGSLRAATMLEIAREEGIPLPAADPWELEAAMRAEGSRDLVEYLRKFEVTLSLLQDPRHLERAAYELAEDAAAEGVRYLEVRYSPLLHRERGMGLEEAVEAPLRGLARAESSLGIRTGLILCGIRTFLPSTTVTLAELAVAYRDRGVVALDLAGAERGNPPGLHAEAFRIAAEGGVGITVHAGEAEGAPSIREALDECHARRIGHGTRLTEDPELMGRVVREGIHLEVCLTSNVQTRVVPDLASHPLPRFLDAGVQLSLNTDNRLVSGVTLTEEYWRAHEHLGLHWNALRAIALMGFQAAFLPAEERSALVEEMEREIARLEADAGE